MKLIVGLGNPEGEYQATRHNLGFTALDEYARKHSGPKIAWQNESKFKAELLKISPDVLLVKPQTYMNNSGLAVKALAGYFKILVSDIILVYDDLDLPLGKIRIRQGGGAAGHHGVESVIKELGSDEFIRVRLGIGNLRSESGSRGGKHFNAESFVLEPFMPGERLKVSQMIKHAIQAVDLILEKGLESARGVFH